ncbi:MAG TPA: flagellar hook-basal body protein [Gaiellales bacterium]|jgi:flagellar basal-body rod protein FlgG|nr:flagellar hook-basal body protein [Gaiellales bacterium]
MDRGLYIAAAGMLAELTRQDQIANDLANASTPGYRGDRSAQQSFGELMLSNRATGQVVGPLAEGVQIVGHTTDMTPAALKKTGEPLDIALDGEGFLTVQTPTGKRYTRDGQLVLDSQGRLATATGLLVLDDRGRPLKAGSPTGLVIAPDGTVTSSGKTVGRLGVVSLTNPVKQGDTLFAGTAGRRPGGTQVVQGSLEGSGINPITAMVDMLTSLRTFEAGQKAIQTIDETLQKGISVGGA